MPGGVLSDIWLGLYWMSGGFYWMFGGGLSNAWRVFIGRLARVRLRWWKYESCLRGRCPWETLRLLRLNDFTCLAKASGKVPALSVGSFRLVLCPALKRSPVAFGVATQGGAAGMFCRVIVPG